MGRVVLALALALAAGGAVTPLAAQKVAPAVTRDTDRDGVPDIRDRCRSTPAGTRVDERGCPVQAAAQPGQPAAQPAAPGQQVAAAPAAAPPGGTPKPDSQPRTTPPAGAAAGAVPPGPVTQAATPPAGAAVPAAGQPAAARPPATPPPAGAQPAAAQQAAAQPVAAQPGAATPPAAQAPAGAQPAAAQPAAAQAAGARPGAAQPQAAAPAQAAPAQPAGAARPGGAPAAAPAAPPAGGVAVVPVPVPGGARPQPAQPAPRTEATPARAAPVEAVGMGIEPYAGESESDLIGYASRVVTRLDSAVVALVAVFRNTSGLPLAGATAPNVLSSRERGRWDNCRLLALDLQTYGEAATVLKDGFTAPALQRASLALADAFEAMQSLNECDNIGSMIEAPERWQPWQQNYNASATAFYRDWYPQVRAVHEATRALARALMAAGHRISVPPGLPPSPPYLR